MTRNQKRLEKRSAIVNEVIGFVLLLASIFLVVSLLTFRPENYPLFAKNSASGTAGSTGIVGTFLAQYLVFALGRSAYSIPLILFFWASSFFLQRVPEKKVLKLVGFFVFMFAASGFMALFAQGEARFQSGGFVGYYFAGLFETYFGPVGGYFISSFLLFLSFILATEFLIFPLVKLFALVIWEGMLFIVEKTQALFGLLLSIEWKLPSLNKKRSQKGVAEKAEKSELVEFLRRANRAVSRKAAKERTEEPKEGSETPSLFKEPPPALKIRTYSSSMAPQTDEEAHKEHERRKDLFNKFLSKKKGKAETPETTSKEKPTASSKKEAAAIEAKAEALKNEVLQSEAVLKPVKNDGLEGSGYTAETPAARSTPEVEPQLTEVREAEEVPLKPYINPPVNLFEKPPVSDVGEEDVIAQSQLLERTMASFGIEAKVVEVEQGPVITRYEILPAPGVRVNQITTLADDIALAMKSPSIRFIAPIPGKSAVGIEIPNLQRASVSMRELLELELYQEAKRKQRLPLLLGKKANGEPLIADLADMPHLLVAGTTGSGKTVCMNSMIIGLVASHGPEDLRFVMVDPKMVELANYNALPHMLMPVVTDSKKAALTLQGVVMEMEQRYNLLAAAGVRNIHAFNTREFIEGEKLDGKPIPKKIPYIVVVIDELADLMLVARDKVETAIQRLAQLSRAVGIHLVLATQKPSVDVITGVIKANLPARIAFQVTSKIDSRIILDTGGADKLIGKGDMLFQPPGSPKPLRAQSTFIQDEEIKRIIEYMKEFTAPRYDAAITEMGKSGGSGVNLDSDKDELYDDAVRVVWETQQASVSTLQRRLGLGYARAARIMDMMEQQGIVGPPRGAKPREILVGQEATEEVSS